MSKPDVVDDEGDGKDGDEGRIKFGVLPASEDVPEDAVHVDITEDPESQDWLAEGRRKGRSKSFFEMSDEEREEVAKEAEKKAERLKKEQNADDE